MVELEVEESTARFVHRGRGVNFAIGIVEFKHFLPFAFLRVTINLKDEEGNDTHYIRN